jgi:N6-adenosine-specific RNA methylase IME4
MNLDEWKDKQAAKLKAKQAADKRIADKYIVDPKAPPKRRKQKPVDDVVESVALDHPARKVEAEHAPGNEVAVLPHDSGERESPVSAAGPTNIRIQAPGTLTRSGWIIPENLSREECIEAGKLLNKAEAAVQWWAGDLLLYADRKWGDGRALAEEAGFNYNTMTNYASICRAFDFSRRREDLSFTHHAEAIAAPEEHRQSYLERAAKEGWSTRKLAATISFEKAAAKTTAVAFDASAIGKYTVIYADPPWRYDHGPGGDPNRSIESKYPTMELDEICALPVNEIAADDSILFMWVTAPKVYESGSVLDAWGFEYRTNFTWVKDKIGTGYFNRNKHEHLFIARRGEGLPVPAPENRLPSVIDAPRRAHSEKPEVVYKIIDQMYPGIPKIELFARGALPLGWDAWGNQAIPNCVSGASGSGKACASST